MVDVSTLKQLIADENIPALRQFLIDNDLIIKDGKVFAKESQSPKKWADHFDRLQMATKINLNALYGCILNSSSRFYDKRIGQSVTLSGRLICRHMNSFVNECITGKYAIDGEAVIAADTDSAQFSAWPIIKPMVMAKQCEWNQEKAVELYLAIGEKVNKSFTPFMKNAFNCAGQFGELIKGSCESVGRRGLYITKKRYAILNYYKDGVWYKPDNLKLKAMGLDLRRSDTPEICQVFLKDILMDLLNGEGEDKLIEKINNFKIKFKALPLHEQGTPKRVNKLTYYADLINRGKGNRVPGHVRAAVHWNELRKMNNDNVHTRIVDGMKCIVCPLKPNALGMTNIAYPTDEAHLPDWFIRLPFDTDLMIASVVDKKIENLLGKLPNWKNISEGTRKVNTFSDFFD